LFVSLEIWEELKAEHIKALEAKEKIDIDVTLPDGNVVKGKAWETSPLSIANQLSYVLSFVLLVLFVVGMSVGPHICLNAGKLWPNLSWLPR
jgi:hypothetical protein